MGPAQPVAAWEERLVTRGDTALALMAAERCMHGFDTSQPCLPRLWNFWAGGKDHYLADRDFGLRVQERFPQFPALARHRLAFRARAVRTLVGELGIDQLLVAGADLPLHDEVHAVAQQITPEVRVVYAAADEMVMAYTEALFWSAKPGTRGFVPAGLDEPDALLDGAAQTLDLGRPIGVLLINSLDALDDVRASAAMRVVRAAVPFGSHVAVCHLTAEYDRELVAFGAICAQRLPDPPGIRSPACVQALCAGMTMIPPGFVSAPWWRPEPSPWPDPAPVDLWCGIGRIEGSDMGEPR